MPAHVIGSSSDCPLLAVIGSHASEGVVAHAGLLRSAGAFAHGSSVGVYESAPPLRLSAAANDPEGRAGRMTAHVVGYVAELSPDQLDGMLTWLQRLRTRVEQQPSRRDSRLGALDEYIAYPSHEVVLDPVTRRPQRERFSCAGLVAQCYRDGGGIHLVDETAVPELDLPALTRVWPVARAEKIRSRVGLPGEGPWRVLVPGYIFHSLARQDLSTPHRPRPGEIRFQIEQPACTA